MQVRATGRLGEDTVYVTTPNGPRLLPHPFEKLIPVQGHPMAPFYKWEFEKLTKPVIGTDADLGDLAKRAIATPVRKAR